MAKKKKQSAAVMDDLADTEVGAADIETASESVFDEPVGGLSDDLSAQLDAVGDGKVEVEAVVESQKPKHKVNVEIPNMPVGKKTAVDFMNITDLRKYAKAKGVPRAQFCSRIGLISALKKRGL